MRTWRVLCQDVAGVILQVDCHMIEVPHLPDGGRGRSSNDVDYHLVYQSCHKPCVRDDLAFLPHIMRSTRHAYHP